MKTLAITIVFLNLFLFVNLATAQHAHNKRNNNTTKILFSTHQSEFSAEVQSASKKLETKEQMILNLKLTSKYKIDSSSVVLKINSNIGKLQKINNILEYSDGLFNTEVMFKESGSYLFAFSFNLIDSLNNLKKTNFSFTKDVEDSDNMTNDEHGMMGMSSVMMIVMGAAMIVMMAIVLTSGGSHK